MKTHLTFGKRPLGWSWSRQEWGETRAGRVLLHALCLLRHPAHARWHWGGIRREFHWIG